MRRAGEIHEIARGRQGIARCRRQAEIGPNRGAVVVGGDAQAGIAGEPRIDARRIRRIDRRRPVGLQVTQHGCAVGGGEIIGINEHFGNIHAQKFLCLRIRGEDESAETINVRVGKNRHIRSVEPMTNQRGAIGREVIKFVNLPDARCARRGGGVAVGRVADGRGLEAGLPEVCAHLRARHARRGGTVEQEAIAGAIDAHGEKKRPRVRGKTKVARGAPHGLARAIEAHKISLRHAQEGAADQLRRADNLREVMIGCPRGQIIPARDRGAGGRHHAMIAPIPRIETGLRRQNGFRQRPGK